MIPMFRTRYVCLKEGIDNATLLLRDSACPYILRAATQFAFRI